MPLSIIQMEGPKDRVGLVVDAVQQLQQNVADFRAGIVQSLAPFMEKLDRIAGFLNRLDQDVNTYPKPGKQSSGCPGHCKDKYSFS